MQREEKAILLAAARAAETWRDVEETLTKPEAIMALLKCRERQLQRSDLSWTSAKSSGDWRPWTLAMTLLMTRSSRYRNPARLERSVAEMATTTRATARITSSAHRIESEPPTETQTSVLKAR